MNLTVYLFVYDQNRLINRKFFLNLLKDFIYLHKLKKNINCFVSNTQLS